MATIENGTVGQVEYLSQNGEWSFLKRTTSVREIVSLGNPTVIPGSCFQDDTTTRRENRDRQSITRQFTGKHTEFVPAASQIIDIYEESIAAQEISQWAISRASPLMTIAYAAESRDSLKGDYSLRKILAYVSGTSGHKLAVARIQLQRSTGGDKIIRRPSLKPQAQAVFVCDGPIEQLQAVYEADNKKYRPYIVTRTRTTIFLLHIATETLSKSAESSFSASCMAIIETKFTGGDGFLHVAVNPWRREQIAILDTKGGWSVWNLASKKSHRTKLAPSLPKQSYSGRIYALGNEKTIQWANATWGCSEKQLIIATRRELFKIDIETGSIASIYENILASIGMETEIMSLGRLQTEPSQILLLTSYTLHLVEVETEIKAGLVWKHCRHPQDRSLSYAFGDLDNDLWIFLYSRYNSNVTVLRLVRSMTSYDISLVVAKELRGPTIGLAILDGSTEQTTGRQARTDVFAIVGINSRYEVWKQDYTIGLNINTTISERPRKSKPAPLSNQILETSDEGSLSGYEELFEDIGLGSTFERLSLGTRDREAPNVPILNLGAAYEEAFDGEGLVHKSGGPTEPDVFISLYLEKLKILLGGEHGASGFGFITCQHIKRGQDGLFEDPSKLFTEIYKSAIWGANAEVGIIDLGTTYLKNDFTSTLLKLFGGARGHNGAPGKLAVGNIYDMLTEVWLECLPINSPAKMRLRRERLARMLSVDIGLSSLGAYPKLEQIQMVPPMGSGSGVEAGEGQSTPASLRIPLTSMPEDDADSSAGSLGTLETNGRDSSRGRMANPSPKMFLEAFSPVTHAGGDSDLDALLNDWDIEQLPDQYQWRTLSSIQHQAFEDPRRSRSNSRGKPRRRRTMSVDAGKQMQNVSLPDGSTMTEPVARVEIATAFPRPPVHTTSGKLFSASQVQKGHHRESRRMKKRRTEGF